MAELKQIEFDPPKRSFKEIPPTYRFDLELDKKCGEYSYAELVKRAKSQESESKQQPGSDDPFSLDEDAEKLQEIARKFEEKYNPKPGRKKKKKTTISEDFVDKGLGYDETDSFIDNEEAYDELVPSTLTTEFGGFYINKGDLEYKNCSDQDSSFDSKLKRKKLRQEKKKKCIGLDKNQKRRGRRPMNETSSAFKPKKKTQLTVADMLQQHKANLLQRMQTENQSHIQLEPIKIDRELEPEVIETLTSTPEETTIVPSTVNDAIEFVVKAATGAEETGSNDSIEPATGSSDGEEIRAPIKNIESMESIEAPKLPDNLPQELNDVIAELKVAAYKSEEGKCKFFGDEVNKMLLSVELMAQDLTSAQRAMIYAHLASYLPCTKETLQKRAKKLRLDQEDGKLREPMQRLREGIAAAMPEMVEKYKAAVQAFQTREEDKKNGAVTGTDDDSQENEKRLPRLPKKRFEWSDTNRKYLCDVVRIKLKCYEVSKTRIQSAEEYLRHFLEAEVKNLWPAGWMQSRILFRESRAAHFYLTNRPKKQILVPKKTHPLSVLTNIKPNVSVLNTAYVHQETEFDKVFQDITVPFTVPSVENVLDKSENMDLLTSNPVGVSVEHRAAEFNKLFTLPINSSVEEPAIKTSEVFNSQHANKESSIPHSKTSSLINLLTDSMVPSQKISKNDKHSKSNKDSCTPKLPDLNTFTEGSLASDMLARIICASLADFPYAGSRNSEKTSKTSNVMSTNPVGLKDPHIVTTKFTNEILPSAKKVEEKQFNTDPRKSSQDVELYNFDNLGINIESFFHNKAQSVSKPSDIIKPKGLPNESSAVNLKLKDSFVLHPRQFAEAFERTSDTQLVNKKNSLKGNIRPSSSSIPSASSRFIEQASERPSSTSPRSLENAQKIALDIAKYNTVLSHGAPYKKRNKYSMGTKANEQWNQHVLEANLGTSLLEGMKGFPFPVGAMPTPPPAHSPHKAPACSISRTPARPLHESDSTHSSISATDVQRRQSLIQGPWKSSSQNPSTSHNHYITSTSPSVYKTTSSNHSPDSVNMSPAHSMSQLEKVPPPYNCSNSSIRTSSSPLLLSHRAKTTYPVHLGHQMHQTSYSVSSTTMHSTVFDSSNPVTTSSAISSLPLSPESKTVNSRTN